MTGENLELFFSHVCVADLSILMFLTTPKIERHLLNPETTRRNCQNKTTETNETTETSKIVGK